MNSACSASVRKVFEVSTEIFGIPRSVLRSDDILTNPRAIILRDKRAFLYKDNDPSQSSGYLQSDILVKVSLSPANIFLVPMLTVSNASDCTSFALRCCGCHEDV